MLFNALFILNFSWKITRGLKVNASLLSIFIQSGLKKSPIEIVIPNFKEPVRSEHHLDLMEYLKVKKEEKKKQRVQHIQVSSISKDQDLTLYLN
jgi:hypothetical protein